MMKIPLLDLRRGFEEIEDEVLRGFKEVFQSMKLLNGPNLQAFEREWSEYLGVKYAFGCSCGTSSLLLALIALGVQRGDEVLIQANGFIADLEAIHYAGAEPVFLEVDPKSFGPDLEDLKRKINPKSKALIVVHMYGHPCEIEDIKSLCDKHGIALIEDASHAHGAEYNGKKIGTFGRIGCFSCGPVKNLNALGDAGVVVTNHEELAHKLKFLRVHGQVEKNHSFFPGFNSRLDELQAIVLRARLKTLDEKNEIRRKIAQYYEENLTGVGDLYLPPNDPPHKKSVYHRYMIGTSKREELAKFLKERGIEIGYYYPIPLHKQRAYIDLHHRTWTLPIAEKLAKELLAIPIYPELTQDELDYIITSIKDFFKQA
ncbi:MAG: DegT/DnrJ/EryC1/StrS family aminotransferase [Caldimicrobium sp.]|nr:DegT/DnrJ/EryC1/StrS family aminotransferase [Caldimicrobium sp.]MDW8181990.1 DegT/DnrJ/EryC1/StrS family aminotransferase [Caldimicrobium sp.]